MKRDEIDRRILKEANYYINNKSTIRETSKVFKVSKSTIHTDLTKKLKYIDFVLYKEVREIILNNINERHIRGGMSTKLKYINKENK